MEKVGSTAIYCEALVALKRTEDTSDFRHDIDSSAWVVDMLRYF